jgi:hypothetical protein
VDSSRSTSPGVPECVSLMRGAWSGCHVYFAAQTSKPLNSMFVSQSRVRTMQLRSRLPTTLKVEMNVAAYFSKMKGFAYEMVAAKKLLEDEDFITYLLAGLNYDYNSFIENVSVRSDPLTISDVYAQFLAAESKLELQNAQQEQAPVNTTMHGGQTGGNRSDRGGDGGHRWFLWWALEPRRT